eukprot:72595_1
MYGENLNAGGRASYYEDDRDYNQASAAPAAAPAYAQDNNYNIEMDRVRGKSNVNSVSKGSGAQHPVYLGDDDNINNNANFAGIVADNEFAEDRDLPDMNVNVQINHNYYRSQSIRDIDSPREDWAANPNSPDPTQGLCGLYIICAVILISAIAACSTFEGYMMNIFIDMDYAGTYFWTLGWNDGTFGFLDNAA